MQNSLQVDINSFKSVQQFGNALWFTAASSVDEESFHDEAFAVRLLLLHLYIIPSAGTVGEAIFSNKQEQTIWCTVDYNVCPHAIHY